MGGLPGAPLGYTNAGTGAALGANNAFTGNETHSGTETFNTITLTKTHQAGVAEVLLTATVDDDATGSFQLINATAGDATFCPMLVGVGASTFTPFFLTAKVTTDSATNPAFLFDVRTVANTAIATRPLVNWTNNGTTLLQVLPLNSGADSCLMWRTNGLAAPAFTTRSIGTRLVFINGVNASSVDYGMGVATPSTGDLWSSIPQATTGYTFKWYAGVTNITTLYGNGVLDNTGTVRSTGGAAPTTGSGAMMVNNAGTAEFFGYNYGGAAYLPAVLAGLTVALSPNGTPTLTASPTVNTGTVLFDNASTIRATGVNLPAAGVGLQMDYTTGTSTGRLLCYDSTGAARKALLLDALTHTFGAGASGTTSLTVAGTVITNAVPLGLASYTVGTLPAASVAAGALAYASNAAGNGPCIAMSNGTLWKRCDNTATTVV